jgi:hypothetical protein
MSSIVCELINNPVLTFPAIKLIIPVCQNLSANGCKTASSPLKQPQPIKNNENGEDKQQMF